MPRLRRDEGEDLLARRKCDARLGRAGKDAARKMLKDIALRAVVVEWMRRAAWNIGDVVCRRGRVLVPIMVERRKRRDVLARVEYEPGQRPGGRPGEREQRIGDEPCVPASRAEKPGQARLFGDGLRIGGGLGIESDPTFSPCLRP